MRDPAFLNEIRSFIKAEFKAAFDVNGVARLAVRQEIKAELGTSVRPAETSSEKVVSAVKGALQKELVSGACRSAIQSVVSSEMNDLLTSQNAAFKGEIIDAVRVEFESLKGKRKQNADSFVNALTTVLRTELSGTMTAVAELHQQWGNSEAVKEELKEIIESTTGLETETDRQLDHFFEKLRPTLQDTVCDNVKNTIRREINPTESVRKAIDEGLKSTGFVNLIEGAIKRAQGDFDKERLDGHAVSLNLFMQAAVDKSLGTFTSAVKEAVEANNEAHLRELKEFIKGSDGPVTEDMVNIIHAIIDGVINKQFKPGGDAYGSLSEILNGDLLCSRFEDLLRERLADLKRSGDTGWTSPMASLPTYSMPMPRRASPGALNFPETNVGVVRGNEDTGTGDRWSYMTGYSTHDNSTMPTSSFPIDDIHEDRGALPRGAGIQESLRVVDAYYRDNPTDENATPLNALAHLALSLRDSAETRVRDWLQTLSLYDRWEVLLIWGFALNVSDFTTVHRRITLYSPAMGLAQIVRKLESEHSKLSAKVRRKRSGR
eukprot:Blabericola_migrator_1__474@NODE_1114_length_5386_cov_54_807295_g761_i0_p1_GENE_NODE_1114_length_5386_cov_54_807295_g761_i0NODE_1114_length_5386_cov_54_807295_g761_i0_p1_ORF_typecomplete_len619_score139_02PEPutilisers_N/PF05524_13/0_27PEPutilisers_N/PF05524_13/24Baculo_PEP_C/PF04513_12/35Baculo_PEP_C/PF04513_12/3_9Baculo_PEP_C/PF04513_12/5_8Baculo_PEP_C/PF04513_12/1_8e03Mer2/PF09074_10/1_5Mer2/PF09074_10/0_56TetR_C_6/PF13977_6/4_8e03TetR_C_6/PF13977_6/0_14TetR_C_6/PF13977_6/9_8e03DUF334/PF03904_